MRVERRGPTLEKAGPRLLLHAPLGACGSIDHCTTVITSSVEFVGLALGAELVALRLTSIVPDVLGFTLTLFEFSVLALRSPSEQVTTAPDTTHPLGALMVAKSAGCRPVNVAEKAVAAARAGP